MYVPILGQVEISFQFYHLRIVIHFLRLPFVFVFSGVPHTVSIRIIYKARTIFAGIQEVEICLTIDNRHCTYHFILCVQQFYKSNRIRSRHIIEYLPILFRFLHLKFFLYLIGEKAIYSMESRRVDFKSIAFTGHPICINIIAHQVQRVRNKIVRDIIPQAVYFLFQMNSTISSSCQRFSKRKRDVVVDIHRTRCIYIYR